VDEQWTELEELWTQPKVKAVGETGLDYYYDYSDRIRQQAVFERHLDASERLKMPVVIHIRDAFDDAYRLMTNSGATGVVHCFTGGPEECERALAMGMYISLSGIVTFKNAKALRAAVPMIPADRLLIETDAPFLAPVPHRGKRNEPAFVVHTAAVVAELRGEHMESVCEITRQNTIELFGLDTP
jgi:TatD DNase family protein